MRRTQILLLTLLLLCGAWLDGWSGPSAAIAAEAPEPASPSTPLESGPVSVSGLPPLPFTKATMDLPHIRQEREASLAAAQQRQFNTNSDFAVTHNGQTALHLDISLARADGAKWIEVNLSEQKMYAWVGDELKNEFVISSGIRRYPTAQGVFRVWARIPAQTMSGGDREAGTYYSLPNVQWVQYFYREYAFHGTYWHNNFGTPMSHGCVNMTIEDAEWLFNWALPEWDGTRNWTRSMNESDATLVWVHQ